MNHNSVHTLSSEFAEVVVATEYTWVHLYCCHRLYLDYMFIVATYHTWSIYSYKQEKTHYNYKRKSSGYFYKQISKKYTLQLLQISSATAQAISKSGLGNFSTGVTVLSTCCQASSKMHVNMWMEVTVQRYSSSSIILTLQEQFLHYKNTSTAPE
jgi:hypothetical protein